MQWKFPFTIINYIIYETFNYFLEGSFIEFLCAYFYYFQDKCFSSYCGLSYLTHGIKKESGKLIVMNLQFHILIWIISKNPHRSYIAINLDKSDNQEFHFYFLWKLLRYMAAKVWEIWPIIRNVIVDRLY